MRAGDRYYGYGSPGSLTRGILFGVAFVFLTDQVFWVIDLLNGG